MTAGGQILRIGQAVVDAQVIEVLEVLQELTGDALGALGPGLAGSLLLIVVLEVGHVASEAPGGGVVHVAGGERVEAELVGTRVDVFHNGLQGRKVLDLVHAVAGLFHEVGVDDDAVALIAVADGAELAVSVAQLIGVGVELLGDRGVGQIEAELAPLLHGVLVAHDEEGGSGFLLHLGHELLVVGAGSSRDDLDGNAGLLRIHLGDLLQGVVRLGLEVQPVDLTVCGSALGSMYALSCLSGLCRGAAACKQANAHHNSEKQCQCFFHVSASPFFIVLL